jgi:hypothetical protein
MFMLILQFLFGLLVANAGEWLIHKTILHGLGKNRHSFWAYHLYQHHAVCTKNDMVDAGYRHIDLTTWNTQSKELVVLAVIVVLLLPLFTIVPFFVSAIYASLLIYYYLHRKAHLDSAWAKAYLPWHYEHHLGGNSNANWCVTLPLFDYLLRTRVKTPSQQ